MRKLAVALAASLALAVLFLAGRGLFDPQTALAQLPETQVTSTLPFPQDIFNSIVQAVKQRPANVLPGNDLVVMSLDQHGDWAIATVAVKPSLPDEGFQLMDNSTLVIASKSPTGWHASIMGTPSYESLVSAAPASVLSPAGKAALRLPASVKGIESPEGNLFQSLVWPWTSGQTWWYGYLGIHGINNSAVDLLSGGLPTSQRIVRAATDGVVVRRCVDNIDQANIAIIYNTGNTTNLVTGYLHLRASTVLVSPGQTVTTGQALGMTYGVGDNAWSGPCGYGQGAHVHFYLATAPAGSTTIKETPIAGATICGWTLGADGVFRKGTQSITTQHGLPNDNCGAPPPMCSAAPTPIAPTSQQHLTDHTPNISWNGIACATKYVVRVQKMTTNGNTLVNKGTPTTTSYEVPTQPKGKFRYSVRGCDATSCGSWSSWTVFFLD